MDEAQETPEVQLDTESVNNLIRHWRTKKALATTQQDLLVARCYIDAYQTIRVNHGLPTLPMEHSEAELPELGTKYKLVKSIKDGIEFEVVSVKTVDGVSVVEVMMGPISWTGTIDEFNKEFTL